LPTTLTNFAWLLWLQVAMLTPYLNWLPAGNRDWSPSPTKMQRKRAPENSIALS
jgi:hypothetical protein